jgi:hypothetical protein
MKLVKSIILIASIIASPLLSQQVQFLNPDKIDVGKIMEGDNITGTIKFVNLGQTPVTIEKIRTSCGCTAAKPDKKTYASGDTAEIDYTIKTKGFKGNIAKSIRIYLEGADVQNASFTIQAYISKDINITPNYLQFAPVTQNSDTIITDFFEIQNETEAPLEIKKVTTYNNLIKIFPENAVIPPHKSHLFQVKFTPKEPGRYDTRISIESDYAKEPVMQLPVFINVRS